MADCSLQLQQRDWTAAELQPLAARLLLQPAVAARIAAAPPTRAPDAGQAPASAGDGIDGSSDSSSSSGSSSGSSSSSTGSNSSPRSSYLHLDQLGYDMEAQLRQQVGTAPNVWNDRERDIMTG